MSNTYWTGIFLTVQWSHFKFTSCFVENIVALPPFLHRKPCVLSLLTVVLYGFVWPLAYISAGGLYTEAEKAAVIWTLGAGTFFPQQPAAQKEGKQSFSDDAMTFTTSRLRKKKKILVNLRKSQLALLFWRFDGLHHNIVLLVFSSGLQRTWPVIVMYLGFFSDTHFT